MLNRRTLHFRRTRVALASALAAPAAVAITIGVPGDVAHGLRAPQLVADVNTDGESSFPDEFVVTKAGLLFFAADDGRHGRELWVSDNGAPPTLVADINPYGSSDPYELFVADTGVLYFAADDAVAGTEVWRSDGTEAGTYRVADIQAGAAGSNPRSFVTYAGLTYFSAATDGVGTTGRELWRTDGTAAGTTLAADLRPGRNGSDPREFTVVDHGAGDRRLWLRADASGSGTDELVVYDAPEGASADPPIVLFPDGNPADLTAIGDTLYTVTGTSGANRVLQRVERSAAGPPATYTATALGGLGPTQLLAMDGDLYLSSGVASVSDQELHVLDGDTIELVDDINAGPDGSVSGDFTASGGYLYFPASDGVHGEELWRSDGTETGTTMVADVAAGAAPSQPAPVVGSGGALFFTADDQVTGRELWFARASDGAVFQIEDLFPGTSSSAVSDGEFVAGSLFLGGNDLTHGNEVMRLDVSTRLVAGATDITVFADLAVGTTGSTPYLPTAVGSRVMFAAMTRELGTEPWLFDPATRTTALLRDLIAGPGSAWASETASLGTSAVLAAESGGGYELWATDGTPAGTTLIDIESGVPAYPQALTRAGAYVYFTADHTASGRELWRTDGTAAGTQQLVDVVPGPADGDIRELVALGGQLVFVADSELWITDGTPAGTRRVVEGAGAPVAVDDLGPGVPGNVMFSADLPGVPGEQVIWVSDGTSSGTTTIASTPHGNPRHPQHFSRSGDTVYFAAFDGSNYRGWATDGTSAGTRPITAYPALPLGRPFAPVAGGGAAFSAYDPASGSEELWLSDGTLTGTHVVDLVPGPGSSNPANFVNVGRWTYFTATTPTSGNELWRTDGVTTEQVSDFNPGPADGVFAAKNMVTVIGDDLYFTGDDGTTGDELWLIAGAADVPAGPSTPTNPLAPPGGASPIEAIDPARFLDTRDLPTFDGVSSNVGRQPAGSVLRVPIAGRGGVPSDATGVVANLTVVAPDAPGHATLFPCTPQPPNASHLNYLPGDVLADNAVVPLDATGALCIYTRSAADYVLDVNGFVGAGSPIVGVDPARYLDTRTEANAATFDGLAHGGGAVPADQTIEVPIAGRGAVPAGAGAAFVTVTAVAPGGPGYLTLYPCGPRPHASNVNYAADQIVPNGAVVELSPTGSLCIFTKAASHLIVDVAGYLPDGSAGLSATSPERLLDTRPGGATVDGANSGTPGRLAAEQVIEIQVAGRGSIPAGAAAALLNVGLVAPSAAGYATLYPCGARPTASNVNAIVPGSVRANNALTKLSPTGTVCIFVKAATDVILDATGWVDRDGDPGDPGTDPPPEPGAGCARTTSLPQPGDTSVDLVLTGRVLGPDGLPVDDGGGSVAVVDRRSDVGAHLGEASVNDAGFFLVIIGSNAIPADTNCRDYWLEVCAPAACAIAGGTAALATELDVTDLISAATGQGRQDIDISDDELIYSRVE